MESLSQNFLMGLSMSGRNGTFEVNALIGLWLQSIPKELWRPKMIQSVCTPCGGADDSSVFLGQTWRSASWCGNLYSDEGIVQGKKQFWTFLKKYFVYFLRSQYKHALSHFFPPNSHKYPSLLFQIHGLSFHYRLQHAYMGMDININAHILLHLCTVAWTYAFRAFHLVVISSFLGR